ncbi:MAG: class I SAM-dependent methyltransferase [Euryarchaeota archaeon]|nr:class I SAM-dependent methyltransferase [Euryarchaeota archaeon]
MAKSKIDYWSESSQGYDKSVDSALGGNIRPLINENLKLEGHLGTVVEFGCGTGYFTKTLAGKAEHVVATDFSDDMLRIAQTQLEGFDNVEFKNENWQHTTFADETFDTIFAGFVIPCVDDKVQALKESQRILKPAGRIIIASPNILLLSRFRLFQFLCRNVLAWRGKLPPVSFRSVSELLDETTFTVESLDVMKDLSNPSSAPVEYAKLLKS